MSVVTRWIEYDISAVGSATDGGNGGKGTRGYSIGTSDPGDTISIGPTTNRLHLSLDGGSSDYITLYSGSNLDPRFVARDITEKLHNTGTTEAWTQSICTWENTTSSGGGNRFVIRSGSLGSSSSVTVGSGTNDARAVLGFNTKSEFGGSASPDGKASYTFSGDISISGTYYGFLDDVYKIVITNDHDATRGIGTPSKGGSNTYAGTLTTGGLFNHTSDLTYTIQIDATNGTTMGAGTGNVPLMKWSSSTDSGDWIELLYPNYWYKVGKYGLMVKFTDAVFNSASPAWTIPCYKPDYAQGTNASAPVGTAQYTYSSERGDDNISGVISTVSGSYTALGSRGLSIKFNPTSGSDNLGAGDCFYVICSAPKPSNYNISNLNYGNVTVSTESSVKTVAFEIQSGATQLSTVKFGLQNHGTFSHHNAGNSDTYFRFGTVGPGNVSNGYEWYPNITAADIDSDTPPTYLYATDDNLPVVATADDSKSVGNSPLRGLMSDPIWLNIRVGASETGANSSINYRLYFDYV